MKELVYNRALSANAMPRMEQNIENVVKDANRLFKVAAAWDEVRVSELYSAKPGEFVYLDPSIAGFTVLLPEPASCVGQWICLKNITTSVNAVVVQCASGENVNGSATLTMNTAGASVRLRASTDGWWSL